MSMIISQDYMETYVINPMAKWLAEIEKKIDKLLECKCEPKQEISDPEIVFKFSEKLKPTIKKVK